MTQSVVPVEMAVPRSLKGSNIIKKCRNSTVDDLVDHTVQESCSSCCIDSAQKHEHLRMCMSSTYQECGYYARRNGGPGSDRGLEGRWMSNVVGKAVTNSYSVCMESDHRVEASSLVELCNLKTIVAPFWQMLLPVENLVDCPCSQY